MFNKTKEQVNEIAQMIVSSGNTHVTHLYAIENKKTSLIINYKNKMLYTTRKSAREARRMLLESKTYVPKDLRIVTTGFVNVSPWKTAK